MDKIRHGLKKKGKQVIHTSRGVLKPKPTLRLYRIGFLCLVPKPFLRFKKMVGCL